MSLYVSDVMGDDGDDGDDEDEELLLSSLSLSTVLETRRAVVDGCVPSYFEEVGGLKPEERKSSCV